MRKIFDFRNFQDVGSATFLRQASSIAEIGSGRLVRWLFRQT